MEGDQVRFTCRVTGRPAPEIVWYKGGQRVSQDARHKVIVNEAGCHALLVTGTLPVDSGPIGCVATNRSGEASFSVFCLLLPTAFDRHLAVLSECNSSALVTTPSMGGTSARSACWTRPELCAQSKGYWGSSPHIGVAKGKIPNPIPIIQYQQLLQGWTQHCPESRIEDGDGRRRRRLACC